MARPPQIGNLVTPLSSNRRQIVTGGEICTPIARRRQNRRFQLPIKEPIIRTIMGDAELTIEIAEASLWSQELSGSIDYLTSDPFQQMGGQSASWEMSMTQNGRPDGPKTHPDIVAIGNEMKDRMFNRRYVLGGDRLQQSLESALMFGDGFLEMEIAKDGLGSLCISRTLERPSLSTFIGVDDVGEIDHYVLRSADNPNENFAVIPAWKLLHFSRRQGANYYGDPICRAMIDEAWRPLKQVAADLSDAVRAAGVQPLVHEFGADTSETDMENYKTNVNMQRESGIITDLFTMSGMKISQLTGGGSRVGPLVEAFMTYRAMMIVPGVQAWRFPAIAGKQDSNKDIANQPALDYARRIAGIRSLMGQQIKWAVSLEIVLKKGYEFYRENGHFEIVWGDWFVTGMEQGMMSGNSQGGATTGGGASESQRMGRLDAMMTAIESRLQRSIDLDNAHQQLMEAQRTYEPD
jgi:hypothetical protein